MALSERVTNDYADWTEGGQIAWVITAGPIATNTSPDDEAGHFVSYIEKEFTLARAVLTAHLTVNGTRDIGEGIVALRAQGWIKLKDADGVWHTLDHETGDTNGSSLYIWQQDIAPYLTKAGTYTLRLEVSLTTREYPVGSSNYQPSTANWGDVSLMADTITDWEITLDELAPASAVLVGGITFAEPAAVLEHFDCVKTTPPVTKEERLIAGIDDNTVLIFATGAPDGYFETDDDDFGYAGMDKQLDEVQFESSASAPHTVTVRVSTNSGLTWQIIGTVAAQRGKVCSVFCCITAEKHRVCFRGNGLRLSSYTLYAYPKGKMAKEAV